MEDRQNTTTGAKRGSRKTSTSAIGSEPSMANDTSATLSEAEVSGKQQSEGQGFLGKVRERASVQLNTQKDRATEGIGSAAQAVRQSTQQLREQKHDTVAQYIDQAADQLDRFAKRIREKNVNELLDDAQRFARRQPALFIGGAFALGLLGSRFFKSSSSRDRGEGRVYGGEYSGPGGYGSAYRAPAFGTTGGASTFGTSDVGGPADSTGGSGTISGTPRDLPGTETY